MKVKKKKTRRDEAPTQPLYKVTLPDDRGRTFTCRVQILGIEAVF